MKAPYHTPIVEDLADTLNKRAIDEKYGGNKEIGSLLQNAANEIDRLNGIVAKDKNSIKYARQVLTSARFHVPPDLMAAIDLFLAQVK